jgi:hypothetical protein
MENLIVFDFDATLIDSQMPETGKPMWLEKKGVEYPHKGWWGRIESLDPIFVNPVNPWVVIQYDSAIEKGYYTILLTGRVVKLEKEVKRILVENDIIMDELHLSNRYPTIDFKIGRLTDIVEKNKDTLKYIVLYDDREEHSEAFIKWGEDVKKTYGIDVRYDMVVNGVGTLDI